jgi:tetratricopeptide (TPR) repeat protein
MFHRGRYRQAAHQFEVAIAEDPNNWEAHWWLGLTMREMRDYDGCLDHFRVAIRLHDDPDWVARVRVDVGLVWELRGDRDKALVEYDLALRARPGYADAIKARERLKERREALKEREDDKDKGHRGNKGKRRSERDD